MSISRAKRSVSFPLPSSPHWVPTTTVAGTSHLRSICGLRTTVALPDMGVSKPAGVSQPAAGVGAWGGDDGMSNELHDVRVAFLVANEGIEEVELTQPWRAVMDAGGQPELVASEPGMAETMHHLDRAGRFPVDQITEEVGADDYDAVVPPGGVPTPDQRRGDASAVVFLMAMFEVRKPVAA